MKTIPTICLELQEIFTLTAAAEVISPLRLLQHRHPSYARAHTMQCIAILRLPLYCVNVWKTCYALFSVIVIYHYTQLIESCQC